MKKMYCLLLLFTALNGSAQPGTEITLVDFVKIKNNHNKEALYYYENNWKAYRDEALKRGIIQAYQLLSTQADSLADFHLMLITVYKDSSQFKNGEAAFAPILKEVRPNGPLLFNALQPADFRQNLYYKTASTVFVSGKTRKRK